MFGFATTALDRQHHGRPQCAFQNFEKFVEALCNSMIAWFTGTLWALEDVDLDVAIQGGEWAEVF